MSQLQWCKKHLANQLIWIHIIVKNTLKDLVRLDTYYATEHIPSRLSSYASFCFYYFFIAWSQGCMTGTVTDITFPESDLEIHMLMQFFNRRKLYLRCLTGFWKHLWIRYKSHQIMLKSLKIHIFVENECIGNKWIEVNLDKAVKEI